MLISSGTGNIFKSGAKHFTGAALLLSVVAFLSTVIAKIFGKPCSVNPELLALHDAEKWIPGGFLSGNGIISDFFVPVNASPPQNIRAIKTVFKSIKYFQ
jgi:hypothetical protein